LNQSSVLPVASFAYVIIAGDCAYYASAATEPSEMRPVGHALQWHAIRQLKAAGVRWYELGWVDKPDFSEKEKHIAFFKSGFGGVDVPLQEVVCRP
jgi:lipid II:glycine glycyltransferase (peptidoglycan interpeptide bridge formation enzyme)